MISCFARYMRIIGAGDDSLRMRLNEADALLSRSDGNKKALKKIDWGGGVHGDDFRGRRSPALSQLAIGIARRAREDE